MPVREWDGPPPFGGKATAIIGGRKPAKGWSKRDSPPEPDGELDGDADNGSRNHDKS